MSVCQVCELQSSLAACREELNLYQEQMEELKKIYETELQRNNDKVQSVFSGPANCEIAPHSLQFVHPPLIFLFCLQSNFLNWIFSFAPSSSSQLSSLQEKLHTASLDCHSSGEQNLQLQLSLQQQQTMLTESTTRITELEESQSQLQRQVRKTRKISE